MALHDDLVQITQKGGFTLRKWVSNDLRLTHDFSNKAVNELLSLDSDTIKNLGISWNSRDNTIIYVVNKTEKGNQITKRSILSEIAKLFDPLGLLGPFLFYAKLMIKHLWKLQITWDGPLPTGIESNWVEFRNQLPCLNELHFCRCIISPNFIEIQVHGFCVASEKAYGACIYLCVTDSQGKYHVCFVCSKSRAAPAQPVTLPRFELCAAVLLSHLYATTYDAFKHIEFSKIFLWSDSTSALHWIKTPPHR
ncbi:uncharacterized protein LOC117176583 [Belonocnema kinseyi]|uniref:uncharacterized protein LOC117176583 n=1 Tax=Belonocnema kinseyi TaxID=2817044 RepID=UPI00143DAAF8|nr:uncharacterized protein LOC117176583 [Belonocnema kinseyi]